MISLYQTDHERHCIAHAAGFDAGNRSMHAAGRIKWNADDYNAAAAEYNRIFPEPKEESQ